MISADRFKWDKGYGRANASDLGFKCVPNELKVVSPLTGKIVDFKLGEEEAVNAEHWDGEYKILRSSD